MESAKEFFKPSAPVQPSLLPHQQRVKQEREDLNSKLDKLSAFFKTPEFNALNPAEQGRMKRQYAVMQQYEGILSERMAAWA